MLTEYCQWETFNATCSLGSVVVMQSARYGRMKHGRCADTDVYIGCSADVLLQMDERCSGRQSCMLAIPDSYLHQQQPCPNDMMAYLEASFTCVRGLHDARSLNAPWTRKGVYNSKGAATFQKLGELGVTIFPFGPTNVQLLQQRCRGVRNGRAFPSLAD